MKKFFSAAAAILFAAVTTLSASAANAGPYKLDFTTNSGISRIYETWGAWGEDDADAVDSAYTNNVTGKFGASVETSYTVADSGTTFASTGTGEGFYLYNGTVDLSKIKAVSFDLKVTSGQVGFDIILNHLTNGNDGDEWAHTVRIEDLVYTCDEGFDGVKTFDISQFTNNGTPSSIYIVFRFESGDDTEFTLRNVTFGDTVATETPVETPVETPAETPAEIAPATDTAPAAPQTADIAVISAIILAGAAAVAVHAAKRK